MARGFLEPSRRVVVGQHDSQIGVPEQLTRLQLLATNAVERGVIVRGQNLVFPCEVVRDRVGRRRIGLRCAAGRQAKRTAESSDQDQATHSGNLSTHLRLAERGQSAADRGHPSRTNTWVRGRATQTLRLEAGPITGDRGQCWGVIPQDRTLRSTTCYTLSMSTEVTQRELRNNSGEIMRGLDQGKSYIVTRNGVPVGELAPMRRHRFVSAEAAVAVFKGAPSGDLERLRRDLDRVASQAPDPRA